MKLHKPLIFNLFVRFLYPLLILYSLYVLYRGHNEPGGGFIAALIAVCASAICSMAYGTRIANNLLPWGAINTMTIGIGCSLSSGVLALIYRHPFLTHFSHQSIPVGTATLFDIGVYLTVWGSISLIVFELISIAYEGEKK